MSTLKTNNIQHVDRSEPSIIINTDGSVNIAGTVSYEDSTNVDSVGVVTARKQLHVGTGVSIAAGGLNVTAGISTLAGIHLDDALSHTGDTNTKIRFPSADTFTVETAGSERVRVTSSGVVGINTVGARGATVEIQDIGSTGPTLLLAGGTNTEGDIVVPDGQDISLGHWNNSDTFTERLQITSGGIVQIGGATENSADIDTSNTKLIIKQSGSAQEDGLYMERSGERRGHYIYVGGALDQNDALCVTTNQLGGDTDLLAIDRAGDVIIGAGNLGIHSTSPDRRFTLFNNATTRMNLKSLADSTVGIEFGDPADHNIGFIVYDNTDDSMQFGVNAGERLRINSSGNTKFVGIVTATEFIPTETQLSHRNMIINGNMRIAQRATTSTSSGIKTVDRWDTLASGMDQLAFTQKRVTDSPNIHAYSYEINITTAESAQAGDEYMRVQQKIEAQDLQHLAWGTSDAKTVTVSFWVKAYQTGTYVVNFYRQDANRHITRTYTINASATWEYKSVTIPGDTGGSEINNDTGAGIHLAFVLIADSGYLTTNSTSWINYTDAGYGYGQGVNLGSSSNNYWKITGVQFEQGSQPTPYENQKFDDILFACQRYYCELGRRINFDGTAATSDSKYSFIGLQAYTTQNLFGTLANFPRKMRAKPTITMIGHVKYSNKSGGNIYSPISSIYSAITHETVGTTNLSFDTAHFIQGGFACGFTDNDNANYNYITADAEI